MLGAGAFGRVLKGEAEGIVPWEDTTVVAVKMLKPKPTAGSDHYDYLKALVQSLSNLLSSSLMFCANKLDWGTMTLSTMTQKHNDTITHQHNDTMTQ
jgi:hypothetical protein